jgi:hypothetical protein
VVNVASASLVQTVVLAGGTMDVVFRTPARFHTVRPSTQTGVVYTRLFGRTRASKFGTLRVEMSRVISEVGTQTQIVGAHQSPITVEVAIMEPNSGI